MTVKAIDEGRGVLIEGEPDAPWLTRAGDVNRIIEACWAHASDAVLLYATNLPPAFFDLSAGVAGDVLQKLRTYRIRLAIVHDPQTTPLSTRFPELLAEERNGRWFGLFESRDTAVAWLDAGREP